MVADDAKKTKKATGKEVPARNGADAKGNTNEPKLAIQRLYLVNLSFEAPNVPQLFTEEWDPSTQIDIQSKANPVGENSYAVILRLTVTVKSANKMAFLVEIDQAGLFEIQGLEGEQLQHCLASYCPNILYPYARETITDIVTRASFPQLILAPVNFDALYEEHLQRQAGQGKPEEAGEAGATTNS